jgi:hypothetical protein
MLAKKSLPFSFTLIPFILMNIVRFSPGLIEALPSRRKYNFLYRKPVEMSWFWITAWNIVRIKVQVFGPSQ